MKYNQFDLPIVLIIYKRSINFDLIIKSLRTIRPTKIYIIADGPAPGHEQECHDTRVKLEKLVNWPCTIQKNYAEKNLGLKKRFSSGIDWVFEHEDRAIFIEDDCIPDPSFFRFCDELLEKFKDNDQVMTISGDNFQFGKLKIDESYYFSRYPHVWGWATWKRAWSKYDQDMQDWPINKKNNWLVDVLTSRLSALNWSYIFDRMYQNKINTWDYQLTYMSLKNKGLNIIPSVNLVSNHGYDNAATHTKRKSKVMDMATDTMKFPLVHPSKLEWNDQADKNTDRTVFLNPISMLSLVIKSILGIL
jgi:hypothetical protein